MTDDDQLERALDALAMEDPPPGLHARIMAATVYRPAPEFGWDVWIVGVLLALACWSLVAISGPAGAQASSFIDTFFRSLGRAMTSAAGVGLIIGVGATLWVTLFTVPTRPATFAGR